MTTTPATASSLRHDLANLLLPHLTLLPDVAAALLSGNALAADYYPERLQPYVLLTHEFAHGDLSDPASPILQLIRDATGHNGVVCNAATLLGQELKPMKSLLTLLHCPLGRYQIGVAGQAVGGSDVSAATALSAALEGSNWHLMDDYQLVNIPPQITPAAFRRALDFLSSATTWEQGSALETTLFHFESSDPEDLDLSAMPSVALSGGLGCITYKSYPYGEGAFCMTCTAPAVVHLLKLVSGLWPS